MANIQNTREDLKELADAALGLYADLRNPSEHLIADATRLGILPPGSKLIIPKNPQLDNTALSWGGITLNAPDLTIPSYNVTTRLTRSEIRIVVKLLNGKGNPVSLGEAQGDTEMGLRSVKSYIEESEIKSNQPILLNPSEVMDID